MQCLRCGREIEGDQVFCFLCESVMVKQPVKPNTVVTIPERSARVRSTPVRKPARCEDDTEQLRRTILQLRLWVCMLMAALMLCVGALTWQELTREEKPAIGQNYSSIIDFGGGGR
ncbi:MAG: hypothetical protein IJB59_05805 [Oscillospiraceae bacterium]|nr:hypothetical protein [Oscillospiraceae bacterium]